MTDNSITKEKKEKSDLLYTSTKNDEYEIWKLYKTYIYLYYLYIELYILFILL
jgi:hypothetical protein